MRCHFPLYIDLGFVSRSFYSQQQATQQLGHVYLYHHKYKNFKFQPSQLFKVESEPQSPPPFNCVLVRVGNHVPHTKPNILICKYTCNSNGRIGVYNTLFFIKQTLPVGQQGGFYSLRSLITRSNTSPTAYTSRPTTSQGCLKRWARWTLIMNYRMIIYFSFWYSYCGMPTLLNSRALKQCPKGLTITIDERLE